jgi:putative FmdB family regulatory protein
MPLYEYQCKKCKHTFEKIQSFSDQPVKKCPKCAGPVEKLLSAPAVQFKGTGWYVTDYAGKSKAPDKPTESKETASADGASSASENKTEKADAKTEPKKADKKKK